MENIVEVTVEIPMGTKNKYEIDKETGRIKLNRVQYSSMTYPAEYGFVDETLSEDNDPLDVLVLMSEPTFPGCLVDARIVGYLKTIDGGYADNKIIAVSNADPRFNHISDIEDLNEHILLEIKNFFQNYKILQKIKVEVFDFYPKKDALKVLIDSKTAYKNSKE